MEYGTLSHNYETGTLTIDLFMPEEMYEDGVLGKVCGVTVCEGWCVEGWCVEGWCVEGWCMEGWSMEGQCVEGWCVE